MTSGPNSAMETSAGTGMLRAAREFLMTHRTDYETAVRDFRWPRPATFNFGLDWFDVIAAEHPDRPALAILEENGDSGSLPEIDSCVELFPTANFQEREVFDFFGIVFRGHPDMTRILMPEDYVGYPQRRDFPVGGEPVTFTYNEKNYG